MTGTPSPSGRRVGKTRPVIPFSYWASVAVSITLIMRTYTIYQSCKHCYLDYIDHDVLGVPVCVCVAREVWPSTLTTVCNIVAQSRRKLCYRASSTAKQVPAGSVFYHI